MRVVHTKNVDVLYLCRLASKNLRDLRVPPRSSQELGSSGSGKIATTRCVITRKSAVRGGTLKSIKFLLARRHKYHTSYSISSDFFYWYQNSYYMVFQIQPQLKIFIMPNIYSSTISHTGQTTAPNPQKPSTHHIAILVPHDKLVMKSYMHIRLAIVETQYHNLNDNIKNQEYWPLTSNVVIKIQKALNQSTGLFSHILGTSSLQNITKNTTIWYTPSNSISPSD